MKYSTLVRYIRYFLFIYLLLFFVYLWIRAGEVKKIYILLINPSSLNNPKNATYKIEPVHLAPECHATCVATLQITSFNESHIWLRSKLRFKTIITDYKLNFVLKSTLLISMSTVKSSLRPPMVTIIGNDVVIWTQAQLNDFIYGIESAVRSSSQI